MGKNLQSFLPGFVEAEPVFVTIGGYDSPPEEAGKGEPMAPSTETVDAEVNDHLLPLDDVLPYYDAVDEEAYLNLDIPEDAVLVPLEECGISVSDSAGTKKHKKKKDKAKNSKKSFLEECRKRSSGTEVPPVKNTREIRFPADIKIGERLTEHKLYCILIKKYSFGYHNNDLYVRDSDGVHSLVNEQTVEKLLMSSLTEAQKENFRISDSKGVAKRLRATEELKANQLTFSKTKVLLANGCFDLSTKRPAETEASDFFLCRINARYLPGEKLSCPNFDHYLETSSGGDESIKARICAMLGYLMLSGYPGKKILVMGTDKNSSKSMISRFYQRLVGPGLVCGQTPFDMSEKHALSEFSGKIANIAPDLADMVIKPGPIGMMKNLSGGDSISVNPKCQDRRSTFCFTKQILGTNFPLRLQQFDEAFWERVEVIPYVHSISPEDRIDNLEDLLFEERDAIVTKCLKEARRLIKNGYRFPECPAADAMKDSWIGWQSYAKVFLQTHCVVEKGSFTPSTPLYNAYLQYCEEKNLPRGLMTGFITYAKKLFPSDENPHPMIQGVQLRGLPDVRFLENLYTQRGEQT